MKRKYISTAGALIILATLSACGSTGMFDRERPDEFAVTRAKSLTIPADFSLPAPQPAGTGGQGEDTKQEVLDAMFGTAAPGQ